VTAFLPRNTILLGDARHRLRELPSASVDYVITSPPYFNVRNYGHDGQIGLEPTVEAWVGDMRAVFAEVARVLKPTGSFWLNLGDGYSRRPAEGVAHKSLLLGPEPAGVGPDLGRLAAAEQGYLGQEQPDAVVGGRSAELYLRGCLLLHPLTALFLRS
jgi:hypothetical protein